MIGMDGLGIIPLSIPLKQRPTATVTVMPRQTIIATMTSRLSVMVNTLQYWDHSDRPVPVQSVYQNQFCLKISTLLEVTHLQEATHRVTQWEYDTIYISAY